MEEAEAYGCTYYHRLDHPEYYVVMYEVGRNTNMKEDRYIDGEMYLCEPGMISQHTSSRTDKHFTLLGLPMLTGEVKCAHGG